MRFELTFSTSNYSSASYQDTLVFANISDIDRIQTYINKSRNLEHYSIMLRYHAPQSGFEPETPVLTERRSTTDLLRIIIVPHTGLEPVEFRV